MDALSTLVEPPVVERPAPPSPVHPDQSGVADAAAEAEAEAPIPHHTLFAATVFAVLGSIWAGAIAGLLVWAI